MIGTSPSMGLVRAFTDYALNILTDTNRQLE
jgi:hypothetical protein